MMKRNPYRNGSGVLDWVGGVAGSRPVSHLESYETHYGEATFVGGKQCNGVAVGRTNLHFVIGTFIRNLPAPDDPG